MTTPKSSFLFLSLILILPLAAQALEETADSCGDMAVWESSRGMCQPLAMAGMPMKMLMIHGNGFLLDHTSRGPRGRDRVAAPHMLMMDIGSSVDDRHYLNAEIMATFEKWTFPRDGNPELLQMGEQNEDHIPYFDAQHPHSSPLMGLTLSDTLTLEGDKNYVKFFFAPRGASTDGPVAFMHRPTGMVNPDAPLGHHVGQDVGHISSTVVGAQLKQGKTTFEASTFSGAEPHPDRVDLPIYTPNSYAVRLIRDFSPRQTAMVSAAYVKSPDPDEPELDHLWRYSASASSRYDLLDGWIFQNSLIYGLINSLDDSSALNSFSEEFLFRQEQVVDLWGRLEYLQRTPRELFVANNEPTVGQWVTALTIGYSRPFAESESGHLDIGGSVTQDFLPKDFEVAYGSKTPWSAQIFLHLNGMKMWEL